MLLYLNLVGLALLVQRWTGYPLARIWPPALVATTLFFLEHFIGLGSLRWVAYVCSPLSLWLGYRYRKVLAENWGLEAVFAVSFLYSLLWRYHFPDLDGTHSEKLTDFSFILNYSRGTKLPPADSWFPPLPFDMYYALQHYAAALAGRILGLLPGQAYHLSFCTIVALTATAAWISIRSFNRTNWQRWLLMAALLAGGTGATLVIHAMKDEVYPYDTMRFIGGTATPGQATKPFGQWLTKGIPKDDALELPIETFGYLIQLGDYHPPLSGFFLLMGALASIAMLETAPTFFAWATLAASVPLAAAANAWSMPLQALLVGGYILLRLSRRQPIQWLALFAGGGTTLLLLAPFLWRFLHASSGGKMKLQWVPPNVHTPLLLGVILLLPPLLILAASLFDRHLPPLARFLSLFWIACFLLSELVFVDDLYSGRYIRFNTTLKWWGWTTAGAMLIPAAHLLESRRRAVRWLTIGALSISCCYYYDLASYFFRTPALHAGNLEGWSTLTDDAPQQAIFDYIRTLPPSKMLQRLDKGSYTLAPGLILFAGHTPFLGWPDHEKVWRGDLPAITSRNDEVSYFYFAQLSDPLAWLMKNGISHVLWLRTEHSLPPDTWERIDAAIRSRYHWRETYRVDNWRVGFWELRPGPAGSTPRRDATPPE